jgi:Domain of unknown function (DUF6894)
MLQYFFSIRAGDDGPPAERTVELCDDAAALAHACEIVRELMPASPTLIAARWLRSGCFQFPSLRRVPKVQAPRAQRLEPIR